MNDLLLPVAAVLAGVLSITSPCALPLIPSYMSFVTALPVTTGSIGDRRRVALRASLLFVAGFTTVFVALGATASTIGVVLLRNLPSITRISGAVIILLGLSALGLIRLPALARERRFDLHRVARGPKGAFPLGMAFAFGWTPCIGPVLATILTLAASSGSLPGGMALLALYSAGLGVPFVAIGLGYERLSGTVRWLKAHGRAVERLGGVLLVIVGLGYLTGRWQAFFQPAQRWFARYGWPPI